MQLLECCREHGRLTVATALELTGANRNTVKDHLRRLTKAGHLVRHGAGRGTWYARPARGRPECCASLGFACRSYGFAMAPIVGKVSADSALGEDPGFDLDAFSAAQW